MFGLSNLAGISKLCGVISDAVTKGFNAYARYKSKKKRDKASSDPVAEFRRRYGNSMHPDLDDENKKTD